jgi:hypothetical protein
MNDVFIFTYFLNRLVLRGGGVDFLGKGGYLLYLELLGYFLIIRYLNTTIYVCSVVYFSAEVAYFYNDHVIICMSCMFGKVETL